jgi:hypothetical protein
MKEFDFGDGRAVFDRYLKKDHDWRVHPVDCPARPEGAETCNTHEHYDTKETDR